MITKHSIDLKRINEPCFAKATHNMCRVFGMPREDCNSYKCSFYKPQGCKDWVRIEDRTGINLIPPEEAYGGKRK